MKKRSVKVLMALVLAALLSCFAMAAFAQGYSLKIGGQEVKGDNLVIHGGSGTATYDPAKNILTLDHFTYEGDQDGIYYYRWDDVKMPMNIVLKGSNKIAAASTNGIRVSADLIFSGEGSLNVSAKQYAVDVLDGGIEIKDSVELNAAATDSYAYAIFTQGELIISDKAQVNADSTYMAVEACSGIDLSDQVKLVANASEYGLFVNGGDVKVEDSAVLEAIGKNTTGTGILADSGLTVSGKGKIVAKGGYFGVRANNGCVSVKDLAVLEAEASKYEYAYGIYSADFVVSGNARVNVFGVEYGVLSGKDIIVKDSAELNVASNGGPYGAAIQCNEEIVASGKAKVTATGAYRGINSWSGTATVQDDACVTAEVKKTSGERYGLYVNELKVLGGTLEITCPSLEEGSYAVYSRNKIVIADDLGMLIPQDGKVGEKIVTGEGYWFAYYFIEDADGNAADHVRIATHYGVNIKGDADAEGISLDKLSATVGEKVTVTITPAEGNVLESLLVNGKDVTDEISNGMYTFDMPNENVVIEVKWAKESSVVALPRTGDNSHMALWLMLLGMAGAGVMTLRKRAHH